MALKQFTQRRARCQLAGSNDQLRIAGLPVVQRGIHNFGDGVGGFFQKNHARSGKETLRLDGILQDRRVFTQRRRSQTRQPHFLFTRWTDQRADNLLAPQRDTHSITAINQQAGFVGVWARKVPDGVAAGEFHGCKSSAIISSWSMI